MRNQLRPPTFVITSTRWSLRALIAALVLATGISGTARAEILRLDDGSSVEGIVKRVPDGYDVTDSAGKVTHIASERVKGIEISAKASGVVEADSRLASLRRSVENVPDLKSIIERYMRFIDQNKDSPIAKEAEHDLAAWRERSDKGMVKVGPHWMTIAERAQLKEKGAVVAEEARQLLKQGRNKDADALLQQALEADPANVSALYLRGLVFYKQDQVQQARKSFEAVLAQLKDHGPTLNNMAILLWRQNQQSSAMNSYIQAMLGSPQNRRILNNVAEALNALPQNLKTTTIGQKALKIFSDQDTLLQAQMARQGLYRWGSTWLDKAQIERLTAIEKEIQQKLDSLSAEYDDTKKKLTRAEDDMAENVRRMKSMEDASYASDAQGRVFRTRLPRRYYDLLDENKQLAADREEYAAKLDELHGQAKKVQQQLPTPRFVSVQRIIETEGTPGLAATQPGPGSTETDPRASAPPPIEPPAFVPQAAGKPAAPASRPAQGAATQPAKRRAIPDSLLGPG